MAEPWEERLVELKFIVPKADGGHAQRTYTGYRISDDLVLTAGHRLVGHAGEPVDVRGALSREWLRSGGTVAYAVDNRTEPCDAAVIRLTEDTVDELDDIRAGLHAGRIRGSRPVSGNVHGFPGLARVEGRSDLQSARGLTVTSDGLSRYGVLKVALRDPLAAVGDAWEGMSGAPVLDTEDRLLGVVSNIPEGASPQFWTATGLRNLRADPEIKAFLKQAEVKVDVIEESCPLLSPPVKARVWDHMTQSEKLKARHAQVPFVRLGRETVFEQLAEWCGGERLPEVDRYFQARSLVGGAGAGKSRLAVQLCEDLREEGWVTGFGDPDKTGTVPQWTPRGDTLIVVDYAEARAQRELIQAVLKRVRRLQGELALHHRVRLLLISRAESARGGWAERFGDSGALAEMLRQPHNAPIDLTQDAFDERARRAHLDAAFGYFLEHENRMRVERGSDPLAPEPPVEVANACDRPLLIHIAALLAANGETLPAPDSGDLRNLLLDQLLDRERDQWWSGVLPENWQHANQAVAVATLTMPTVQLCAELLKVVPAWSDVNIGAREVVAGNVYDLYNGGFLDEGSRRHELSNQLIAPLEPDLVGEHLLSQTDNLPEMLNGLREAEGMAAANLRRLLHIMDLTTGDYEHVAEAYRSGREAFLKALIGGLLDGGLPGRGDTERHLVGRLEDLVRTAVAHVESGRNTAAVNQLTSVLSEYEDEPGMAAAAAALPLTQLLPHERDHARLRYVIAMMQVNHHRAEPDGANALELANALHQLGYACRKLDDTDLAMQYLEEAVALYSSSVTPEVKPNLAHALMALGTLHWHHHGRAREATTAIEAAQRHLEPVVGERPELNAFYSIVLIRLAELYRRWHRFPQALQALEKAAVIKRSLAAEDEGQLFNLARTLVELGAAERVLGGHEEEAELVQEALGIRSGVSLDGEPIPKRWAQSLIEFAEVHRRRPTHPIAEKALDEAVEALRTQADDHESLRVLSQGMLAQSAYYEFHGDLARARGIAEASVAILEGPAEDDPELLPHLVLSLKALFGVHRRQGLLDDYRETMLRAVGVWRSLAGTALFRGSELGNLQRALGQHYFETGSLPEAVAAVEAAIEEYRRLRDTPDPMIIAECEAQLELETYRLRLDDGTTSFAKVKGAIDDFRAIAESRPGSITGFIALLQRVRKGYTARGRHADAYDVAHEMLGLVETAIAHGRLTGAARGRVLLELGDCHWNLGHRRHALTNATVGIYLIKTSEEISRDDVLRLGSASRTLIERQIEADGHEPEVRRLVLAETAVRRDELPPVYDGAVSRALLDIAHGYRLMRRHGQMDGAVREAVRRSRAVEALDDRARLELARAFLSFARSVREEGLAPESRSLAAAEAVRLFDIVAVEGARVAAETAEASALADAAA
ncbi:MAG TPA: hypothetical protein VFU12_00890 [Glycomyces sp.]|nr:hypothetical protein [Glycomyces sp.]